jgi:hypothetical protein
VASAAHTHWPLLRPQQVMVIVLMLVFGLMGRNPRIEAESGDSEVKSGKLLKLLSDEGKSGLRKLYLYVYLSASGRLVSASQVSVSVT